VPLGCGDGGDAFKEVTVVQTFPIKYGESRNLDVVVVPPTGRVKTKMLYEPDGRFVVFQTAVLLVPQLRKSVYVPDGL